MGRLLEIHGEFVRRAKGEDVTVPSHSGPVVAHDRPVIVASVDRWHTVRTPGGHHLAKAYRFRTQRQRNTFVRGLMAYEERVGHSGELVISGDTVSVTVTTDGVETVTELDKEYASFLDSIHRDVVYSPLHDDEEVGTGGAGDSSTGPDGQ